MPYNSSTQYRRALFFEAFTPSQVAEVGNRLELALARVKDDKERKKISAEAALFVVQSARGNAPKSRKVHYRYRNSKKPRRARGTVPPSDKVAYVPGNLILSIRHLKNLRKTIRAVIGPRQFTDGKRKRYGTSERIVDAYYAQMIFGSGRAFRENIMIPALVSQKKRILTYMDGQVRLLVKLGARDARFNRTI